MLVAAKPASERRMVEGPEGRIEILVECPPGAICGFAFVGHPHPLYGGNLDNKVTATLARAFLSLGWIAIRPNFRGVGASTGSHDNGTGEMRDFLFLLEEIPSWPQWDSLIAQPAPLALGGFSFGAHVAAGAAQELARRGRAAESLVLIGTPAGKWPVAAAAPDTLVIHGEVDETIPIGAVYSWARESDLPVIVIPGADHFFHRRLTLLKRVIARNLLGARALGSGGESADE